MARKSSVAELDPKLRAAIDAAIAGGRVSIDDLVRMVGEAGGQVSRSAMGRYSANHQQALADYREKQTLARQWIAELKENPDGDVAQLVAQMLKLQAHGLMLDQVPGAKGADQTLERLARALKDLALGDKARADLRARLNDDLTKRLDEAAQRVEKVAKAHGLTKETVAAFRASVFGVQA